MRPNYAGWVKLPRSLLLTPVWGCETAWRVFSWLLLSATHCECLESFKGHRLHLRRGQLVAIQLEIGRHTGLSRKSVQTALRLLENEHVLVCESAHGKHVTVYTMDSFPHCQRGGTAIRSGGAQIGTDMRADPAQGLGQSQNASNRFLDNGIYLPELWSGSEAGVTAGAENGTGIGAPINKEEEVKKIRINPPTPFEKGGAVDLRSLVLDMWRKERESACLAFCDDRPTRKGAALVAADWLETGKATPERIRKAMANIIHEIKTNPKARLFDLRTLANSLSKYLDAPKADTPPDKRLRWRMTCDTCGADSVCLFPAGVTPSPVPCLKSKWGGCAGVARPECEGEAS